VVNGQERSEKKRLGVLEVVVQDAADKFGRESQSALHNSARSAEKPSIHV
jgi:hypothetical protein